MQKVTLLDRAYRHAIVAVANQWSDTVQMDRWLNWQPDIAERSVAPRRLLERARLHLRHEQTRMHQIITNKVNTCFTREDGFESGGE